MIPGSTKRGTAIRRHRGAGTRATLVCAAVALVAGALAAAWNGEPAAATGPRPRNLILMIGDGFGPAYVTLGRDVADRPLTLDSMLVGAISTSAADSRVTDSGAAATALACGVRTGNQAIGVDLEGRPRRTILEAAESRGMATGLVATSRITHATPAAFAAHVRDRADEDSIAVQMAAQGIDLLLGGGLRHFRPAAAGGRRKDGRDLLAELRSRGATVLDRPEALRAAPPLPVVGLFTDSHMSYALDRDPSAEPSLEAMTRFALERLSPSRRGFFLMVEGSRIDHAGHERDPATAAREVHGFDAAVRAAVEFARRDGRTLVVVTADHETGGLSLGREVDGRAYYEWRPEVLRRVRRSAGAMARLIRDGTAAKTVLERDAGLTGLGAPELARLDAARGDSLAHEIADLVSRHARVGWTTEGHTAVDVPVWAFGIGSERVRGFRPSDELGRILGALLGLEVGAVAAR
jgi:alkaline phosphatase